MLLKRIAEYIDEIAKYRKSDHHPADLTFWPVSEIHEYFYTVGIKYKEIDIYKGDSDIPDEKIEEFIFLHSFFFEAIACRKMY